jgi:hypothetical protein
MYPKTLNPTYLVVTYFLTYPRNPKPYTTQFFLTYPKNPKPYTTQFFFANIGET